MNTMMATSTRPASVPDESVPLGRLAAWSLFAVALAIGVYLYFRYGEQVTAVLERGG